ncbi:MAG TPA: acyl-ACP--UDP-N-acetylglucosamine O-acyltransferase [Vicinamibacterales bacterium]|nr:acyl-ACP--UDP-N-acetylglucosamine O-acyltransferase [Vicinamibacterales bacterium]
MPSFLPSALDRLSFRYPSLLIDAIAEHEAGRRIVAIKNVTVNEEFFQGHFPGAPMMPGVLMIETLTQAAALLLLEQGCDSSKAASTDTAVSRVTLRGVENAKFRKQVVPGDQLRLEVSLGRRRGPIVRARACATVDDQPVAEADLILSVADDGVSVDATARVDPRAVIGRGSVIGPNAVVGPDVVLGKRCRVGALAVVDGWTIVGDESEIYPFASVGLPPQDLKYKGEKTTLEIGRRNIFREFVTIHRGTAGGGGRTIIGDRNLFMGYVHVAHDCHVGSDTIFGPHATLGGHVTVEDFANISAGSAVHQFCRVGRHAFIGGYSVVTKDALPFARTVGSRPARIFGANSIGLMRRGFSKDTVARLKRAFRYLVQSKLNTSQALTQIEQDPALACPEVSYLVQFIRTAARGVILRRGRKAEDLGTDEE